MRKFLVSSVVVLGLAGLAACTSNSGTEAAAGGDAAAAPAAAPAGGGDDIGVPECDEYLKKMMACLDKMPAEAKAAMEQGFKQSKDAWKQAAAAGGKDALKPGCQAALDALKQNPACQ